MRSPLILLLVFAIACCAPSGRSTETARQGETAAGETSAQAAAPAEEAQAATTGGSVPAPVLVLIGVAIGAALVIAMISNAAVMPDTAP